MNELEQRISRLEENAVRVADLLERMAKSNADLVDLIKGIADALSPKKTQPQTLLESIIFGSGKPVKEPPRHVLD